MTVQCAESAGLPIRQAELCHACAISGACRQGIDDLRFLADGVATGTFVVPPQAVGHTVAHGGWTAWVFDEFLGYAASQLQGWAVTSELAISYRRPVPIGARVTVTVKGEVDGERRRLMGAEMRLAESGVLLAAAEGVWIALPDMAAHYERAVTFASEKD